MCIWTQCSLFNRRPEVSALCAYLETNADKPSALVAERLFEAAFPGEPYAPARLRHTLSYLLQVVRDYLAWTEWSAEASNKTPWLLRSLRKRELYFMLPREEEGAFQILEAAPTRDATYFFNRYRLLQENLEMATKGERSARISLQPLPDALTVFYVVEMLRHACVALTHQAIGGQNYRFALLDALLEAAQKEDLFSEPAVETYFNGYLTLKSSGPEGENSLQKLKALLTQHGERFSTAEMRGLYLIAVNGCIRRMNAGQREYIREAFELYRVALARGFLLEDGWMSGFTYKNIIRIGAALGEEGWTQHFLEQYRDALHPRDRDNHYHYNQAYLFFQRQDYARAMPLLQQVEFEDVLHHLEARRMLLRSYFELGEWLALDSLLQSFNAYLRRQKGIGYHRTSNENLLHFVRRLLEMRTGNAVARSQLKTAIEATPDVAERQWLLQQCDNGDKLKTPIP